MRTPANDNLSAARGRANAYSQATGMMAKLIEMEREVDAQAVRIHRQVQLLMRMGFKPHDGKAL